MEALDKDADLAMELASLIAEDELIIQEQQKQLAHLTKLEEKLTTDLKSAVRSIQSHQRQVQILKANQYSIKSVNGLSQNTLSLNGTLRDLNESLGSIKQRQLRASYLDEAEGEVELTLSGNNLDQRLAASDIHSGKHDAQAVLERLKILKSA